MDAWMDGLSVWIDGGISLTHMYEYLVINRLVEWMGVWVDAWDGLIDKSGMNKWMEEDSGVGDWCRVCQMDGQTEELMTEALCSE